VQLLAPSLLDNERDAIIFVPRWQGTSQRSLAGADILLEEIRRAVQTVSGMGSPFQVLVHADIRAGPAPPVTEQIALFRRARVVIGPHGGALANCLWQAPGSALVELPLAPLQRSEFAVMAAALGLRYWLVPEIAATQLGRFEVTPETARQAGEAVRRALLATMAP